MATWAARPIQDEEVGLLHTVQVLNRIIACNQTSL